MTSYQDVVSPEVQYDEHVKRVLSDRHILAWILKHTTAEFAEFSIEQIATQCVGDDIEVSKRPVMPGRIVGTNTEDKVPGEGTVNYDIRFSAYVPGEAEAIKLLINVEAQKEFYVKYSIVTRGVFYGARMLSSQMNTEFCADDYSGMKKVYSIWICMDAPDYIGNAISEYCMHKMDILAGIPDEKEAYDKMSVVMICLGGTERGKDKGKGLIGLLNTLLSPDMDVEEKIKDLEEIYKLPIEQEKGKEFGHMCNLGEGIREKALADGIERGIAQGIERGMTQGLETALQAMVQSLKDALPTFDDVYKSVTKHEIYKDVTEDQIRKYY